MSHIHPTAIISAGAILGEGCEVGPYCTIGPKVKLGDGCKLLSHVVITGNTTVGKGNVFYPFCSVGQAPQDLKYKGEDSRLELGDLNIIREYVTLHLGTEGGGMLTRVGSHNLFMASSHVGHDCRVGDGNIFANCATLAGHVTIGNRVTLGGLSAIHQFCRLGDMAFLSGGTVAREDIPPFCYATGDPARIAGINKIGLQRAGYSPADIKRIFSIYRQMLRKGEGAVKEKAQAVLAEHADFSPGRMFIEACLESTRGVAPVRNGGDEGA